MRREEAEPSSKLIRDTSVTTARKSSRVIEEFTPGSFSNN